MSAARIASVIVALASVTAAPALAEAVCMTSEVFVWPEDGATVPPNARFVVTFLGAERHRVDYLDGGRAALVSSSDRIPARRVWRSDGQIELTQVVLEPVSPLRSGERYTLVVPESESGTDETEVGTWTVGMVPDTVAPAWRAAPEKLGYERTHKGCGPARNVVVRVDLSELDAAGDGGDAVLLRAELRSASPDGDRVAGYVPVRRGAAAIGHGMCSGMWSLPEQQPYVMVLFAVDVAGNETRMPGLAFLVAHPGNDTLGRDAKERIGLLPSAPRLKSVGELEGVSAEPLPLDPLSLGRLVPAILMVLAIGGMLFASARRRGQRVSPRPPPGGGPRARRR